MRVRGAALFGFVLLVTVTLVAPAAAQVYAPDQSRSLRSRPDTAPLAYLAARDRLGVGDTAGALLYVRRATRDFPYHRPSFVLRFRLLLEDRGETAAYGAAREMVRRTGHAPLLNGLLAGTAVSDGTLFPLVEWAYREGFFTPETLIFLVEHKRDRPDTRGLRSILERGLERFGDNRRLKYLYARYLANRGRCGKALKQVRGVLDRAPGEVQFQLLKARLLLGENREAARLAYDRYRSLVSSPGSAETLNAKKYDCSKG